MRIELSVQHERKALELDANATVEDALRALGLKPDMHVVTRGNKVIPIDEGLSDGDSLSVFKVISGG